MTQLCGRGLTAVDRKYLKFKIVALNNINETEFYTPKFNIYTLLLLLQFVYEAKNFLLKM